MSELNLNLNISVQGANQSSKSQMTAKSGSTDSSVPMVKKLTKEELIKELGITLEQYNAILMKHPDFESMSREDRLKIVLSFNNPETKGSESVNTGTSTVQNAELDKSSSSSLQDTSLNSESEVLNSSEFNKAEFNKADLKTKAQMLTVEYAKNKFLYGDAENPKTVEDWDNLSEEERQNLINKVVEFGKKHKDEFSKMLKLFTENGQASLADKTMSAIQAANLANMSISDYAKLPAEQKDEHLYNYLMTVQADDEYYQRESSFSTADKDFWDRNSFLAESVNHYYRTVKHEDINVCPGDVKKILNNNKDENGNPEPLNLQKIQREYLEAKLAKGEELSDYEKKQYDFFQKYGNQSADELALLAQKEDLKPSDPPSLYSQMINGENADKYFDTIEPENKADLLSDMLAKKYELGSEQWYKGMMDCAKDAYISGDYALAHEFALNATQNAPELASEVSEDASSTELAVKSTTISAMSPESAKEYTENIDRIKDDELRQIAGVALRHANDLTDEQRISISEVKVKDEDVQMANVDMRNSAATAEAQTKIHENIMANSSEKVKIEATSRINELKKEAQISSLKISLDQKNENITRAASNVVSKLDKDNQVSAFKMVKSSVQDMSEDFAKEIEMNLSDQISKSHKDNQLAMHEEIMQSKFSEVQEHAAANIKDYDHSIQSRAIDAVYETGNEKAVKAVIDNLEKMPPEVQKTEVARLIGEVVLDNAISSDNLAAKIMNGELSAQELRSLSASERQKYFMKMFDEAPPAKKLEILMKIASVSSGIHQRTIYTVIARFSPSLLKGMIDSGMGKAMLETGLPLDAVNKIITIMKTSTNNEVIQQLKELQKDSSFEKYFVNDEQFEDSENKKNSATVPNDLKGAFAARIDSPTYEKLKKHRSTMYIKS